MLLKLPKGLDLQPRAPQLCASKPWDSTLKCRFCFHRRNPGKERRFCKSAKSPGDADAAWVQGMLRKDALPSVYTVIYRRMRGTQRNRWFFMTDIYLLRLKHKAASGATRCPRSYGCPESD